MSTKTIKGKVLPKKLYTEIENIALLQGQTELTANVSKTAKPFFEKVGFITIKEQQVMLNEVELTNFKMAKKIA